MSQVDTVSFSLCKIQVSTYSTPTGTLGTFVLSLSIVFFIYICTPSQKESLFCVSQMLSGEVAVQYPTG